MIMLNRQTFNFNFNLENRKKAVGVRSDEHGERLSMENPFLEFMTAR
jgi:hypothetical protein